MTPSVGHPDVHVSGVHEAAPVDPVVAGPDLVVQIRVSDVVGNVPPCLTDELRQTVEDALSVSFAAATAAFRHPDQYHPYVDSTCSGGSDPANQAASFGVWLNAPADLSAARSALDTNIGRAPNEHISFYVNRTLFDVVAVELFPADPPGGSIHLHQPARLTFRSPDTIVTEIDGIDEDPVPDASFTARITEKFAGGPRSAPPPWFTPTTSVDVDGWDEAIYALESVGLFAAGSLVWGPLGLALGGLGWFQFYEVNSADPSEKQGFGSAVASLVMPLSIPIPRIDETQPPLKLLVEYAFREGHNGGVEVDSSGMYTGGFLLPAVREPAVDLAGMRNVSVHVGGGDVDDVIRALATDLRDPTFTWTVNGHPYQSDGPSITLSFNPSVGPFGTFNVAVKATDADGLEAEASLQVTASQTQHHGPNSGSDNPVHPA